MLRQAERLQRQFFQLGRTRSRHSWSPPVDVFEAGDEFLIVVALPGVRPESLEVMVDGGLLIVSGSRSLCLPDRSAIVRRLEIPHGRFERYIELPRGVFEIRGRELANGCLTLSLRRLS